MKAITMIVLMLDLMKGITMVILIHISLTTITIQEMDFEAIKMIGKQGIKFTQIIRIINFVEGAMVVIFINGMTEQCLWAEHAISLVLSVITKFLNTGIIMKIHQYNFTWRVM